jgi:hypothetical protein
MSLILRELFYMLRVVHDLNLEEMDLVSLTRT